MTAPTDRRLALHGGPPTRSAWLPYSTQSVGEAEIAAVADVMRSDWLTTGPTVDAFEGAVADYCGSAYAVAMSNGTAALHAAYIVAGLVPGDEFITTPLTFVATAAAGVMAGAKPVFVDIDDHLQIDPAAMAAALSPRTKMLAPVHFAGHLADMGRINQIGESQHVRVVEDACHALGARFSGEVDRVVRDIAVLSFHPVKHVATGEGGMVLTDDVATADALRRLRHHALNTADEARPWRYEVRGLGFNYRMSDVLCAMGLVQLERMEASLKRRTEIAVLYKEMLAPLEGVSVPPVRPGVEHAWHLFVVLVDPESDIDRDWFISALRAENIGATWHYPLVHLQPFYRQRFGCAPGLCPKAERVAEQMVSLPMFPAMTDEDVEDVVAAITKVVSGAASV